jgi:predicted transport protein
MSFQAYLDTIKAKTGKTPQDFKMLAEKKGFLKPGVKAGEIVAWLKEDFDLGRGHAMAIYDTFKSSTQPKLHVDERVEKHFTGGKSGWRRSFDQLMKKVETFGSDIRLSPTQSYISILRGNKKFAIVQITSGRMDIGIKLKSVPTNERLEPSGTWNIMVTHRVRIDDPKQIDAEVFSWLRQAYDRA